MQDIGVRGVSKIRQGSCGSEEAATLLTRGASVRAAIWKTINESGLDISGEESSLLIVSASATGRRRRPYPF